MPQDRENTLGRVQALLSSPDGELLVEELRLAWDDVGFYNKEPHEVQYMAGQRDAFKYIELLQSGDLIIDEQTEDAA